jgi:hypothetical protein
MVPFAAVSYFKKPKEALITSLIAMLPDLDALLRVHRSITHSLIVDLALSGIALIIIKIAKPKYFGLGIVATLALLSHIFLDLFTTYTPIFWPLSNQSIFITADSNALISHTITTNFILNVYTTPTKFAQFESLDAPIFTSQGIAISAVLLAAITTTKLSTISKLSLRIKRRNKPQ